MPDSILSKCCTKCGNSKPLSEFPKSKAGRYGSSSKCKECTKAWHAAYRDANREKRNAATAKWYAANRDAVKATKAIYRAANPEKSKAADDKWRIENPEKAKAFYSQWQKDHPNERRIFRQNRRARKTESGGELSKGLAEKLFKLQRGKCPCCAKPLGNDYHLDHKIPLALGGSNTDDNMQLLTAACNLQKGSKPPEAFMQSRGFLL